MVCNFDSCLFFWKRYQKNTINANFGFKIFAYITQHKAKQLNLLMPKTMLPKDQTKCFLVRIST